MPRNTVFIPRGKLDAIYFTTCLFCNESAVELPIRKFVCTNKEGHLLTFVLAILTMMVPVSISNLSEWIKIWSPSCHIHRNKWPRKKQVPVIATIVSLLLGMLIFISLVANYENKVGVAPLGIWLSASMVAVGIIMWAWVVYYLFTFPKVSKITSDYIIMRNVSKGFAEAFSNKTD